MKKTTTMLTVLLLSALFFTATAEGWDGGGYPGAALRLGWSVRAAGMGRAMVALTNTTEALELNPAGLAFAVDPQGELFYRKMSLDRNQSSAAGLYPLPFDVRATVALGWYYLGVGGIDGRDQSGNRLGEYRYDEHIASFAFGLRPAEWLGLGVTARAMFTTLAEETATGGAVDVGLQANPWAGLHVGFTARNVIGSYKWKTAAATDEQLPVEYAAGIGYRLDGIGSVEVDLVTTNETRPQWRFGAEYWITPTFAIRGGYEMMDFAAGEVSAGATMVTEFIEGVGLSLDYAFRSDNFDVVDSHAVALSVAF